MSSKEVTLLILFSIFRQLLFPSTGLSATDPFPHAKTCSEQADKHTYNNAHIDQSSGTPKRGVIRGCPALAPHTHTHTFFLLCYRILQESATKRNGRSRKKIGRKRRGKKSID